MKSFLFASKRKDSRIYTTFFSLNEKANVAIYFNLFKKLYKKEPDLRYFF